MVLPGVIGMPRGMRASAAARLALLVALALVFSPGTSNAGGLAGPNAISSIAGGTVATLPANAVLPTVSGTPIEGETLLADPGLWVGTQPMTVAYQWLRCDGGGSCSEIVGETAPSHELTAEDVDFTIRVRVSASNAVGSTDATSLPTATVATPAASVAPPTITGMLVEGATLSADPGGWTGSQPITFAYQWRRCDAAGASCADIAGATGSTDVLTAEDVGATIRVQVTAANVAGTSAASSEATALVASPPVAPPENVAPQSFTGSVTASVGGGSLLLDGQPFFPLIVWGQCPSGYTGMLEVGIDVFMNNPCGDIQAQIEGLAGRGLSVADASAGAPTGAGLIGSYYPDEADAHGFSGDSLPQAPAVRFLTLSNHFYSGAAPLPTGRGMYPGLIAKADMVGFDLYPLQNWCRPELLGDVYAAQRELVALAAGKPTYQWIETAHMDCPDTPALAITPQTVRAESWLAIAGGARGLGFFPIGWTGDVGAAIAGVAHDVQALGPALLAPDAPVSADGPVRVGARSFGGALYLFAVNPTYGSAEATIHAPGLDGRALQVLDEGRQVAGHGDEFSDAFAPLGVHIYVAPAP